MQQPTTLPCKPTVLRRTIAPHPLQGRVILQTPYKHAGKKDRCHLNEELLDWQESFRKPANPRAHLSPCLWKLPKSICQLVEHICVWQAIAKVQAMPPLRPHSTPELDR